MKQKKNFILILIGNHKSEVNKKELLKTKVNVSIDLSEVTFHNKCFLENSLPVVADCIKGIKQEKMV